jgi:hypothetical protein
MPGGGEQRGRGADVGADDVRIIEPECVRDGHDEVAHGARGQQRILTLGMPEPGQVDGDQVGALGEPQPRRLEREQALRPRAEQQGVIVTVAALGEPGGQPVDDPEPHLDRFVQPGSHDAAPHCRLPDALGDCTPAIVRPAGPRSYPPAHSAGG